MALWSIENGLVCHKCNKQLKETRGCNGLGRIVDDIKGLEGIEIDRCPVKMITMQTKYYIDAHGHYCNGFLMDSNCINDESAKVLEAIMLISEYKNKSEGKDA